MRVVLIHGYNSSPEENFHPWLARELKARGFEVIAPKLPLVEEPNVTECIQALALAVGRLDENTIIVGHSLGGVLALRYLEAAEAASIPRATILVGAPYQTKSEKIRGVFLSEFDYDVVAWKAREFLIVHDKEDKLVPFDHAEKYARMLQGELVPTTGDDHFMEKEYPVLLEIILKAAQPLPPMQPGMSLPDAYTGIR